MANNEPKVLVDAPKKTPDTFDNGGQETPVKVVTEPKKQAKPTFKGLKLGKLLAETERNSEELKLLKPTDIFSKLNVGDLVVVKVYDDDDGIVVSGLGVITDKGRGIDGETLTVSTNVMTYNLDGEANNEKATICNIQVAKRATLFDLYRDVIRIDGKVEIYEIGTK